MRPYAAFALRGISTALLLAPAGAQTTIRVPGDEPTIQAALGVAALAGDTVLVAPGTYFESELDFYGKLVHVLSEQGAAATTIDAAQLGRVVTFKSGELQESILEGFTLTGGRAPGGEVTGEAGYPGGGVYVKDSSPTVRGCVFLDNRAGGGAAGISSGSDFAPGGAGGDGGAVYVLGGSPTFEDCRFETNRAGDGGAGGDGQDGTFLSLSDATPGSAGGAGGAGGAIAAVLALGDVMRLERCTFSGNRSGVGGFGGDAGDEVDAFGVGDGPDGPDGGPGGTGGRGGAIAVQGDGGELVAVNCVLAFNRGQSGGWGGKGGAGGDATGGGGIFSFVGGDGGDGGDAGAGGDGGALVNSGAGVTLVSTLFRGNVAGLAGYAGTGGAAGEGSGGDDGEEGASGQAGAAGANAAVAHDSGTTELKNGIVRENYPTADPLAAPVAVDHSNVEGLVPGVGNIDADPLFVGPLDHRLSIGSPCIDASDNYWLAGVLSDADGLLRFVDDPASPNIGAGIGPIWGRTSTASRTPPSPATGARSPSPTVGPRSSSSRPAARSAATCTSSSDRSPARLPGFRSGPRRCS